MSKTNSKGDLYEGLRQLLFEHRTHNDSWTLQKIVNLINSQYISRADVLEARIDEVMATLDKVGVTVKGENEAYDHLFERLKQLNQELGEV